MILTTKLSREEFLGWLAQSFKPGWTPLGHSTSLPKLGEDDVFLIWPEAPPNAISTEASSMYKSIVAIEQQELRKFFAFTATYVSTFVPFTSFFRVVPLDLVRALLQSQEARSEIDLPDELVGVAIAEACSQLGLRARTVGDISLLACRTTISSPILAGLRLGYDPSVVRRIVINWTRARRMSADKPLRLKASHIEDVWTIIAQASAGHRSEFSHPAVTFVRNSLHMREPDRESWDAITHQVPELQNALRVMQGTREDQLRTFDRIVGRLIAADHIDLQVRGIIAGALISVFAQGSLKHLWLALSHEAALPTVTLWFAFFASLHRGSDVLTIGDCLGRRLMRDVQVPRSIANNIECDIGIDEFESLADWRSSELPLRTEYPNSISVELLPGVCGRFQTSRNERGDSATASPPRGIELRELRQLLNHAGRILQRLEGESEQTELFGETPSQVKHSRKRKDP